MRDDKEAEFNDPSSLDDGISSWREFYDTLKAVIALVVGFVVIGIVLGIVIYVGGALLGFLKIGWNAL